MATGQPYNSGLAAVDRELDQLDRTADAGRDNGYLSNQQARHLKREGDTLKGIADRLAADGFSEGEQRSIETHAQILRSQAEAAQFVNPPPKPK